MKELLHLLPYFRPYRRHLIGGMSAIVLAAGFGLVTPLLVGRAIDTLKSDPSTRTLLAYGGLLVLITILQGLFGFAQRIILVTMSRNIEFDLGNDFFRHLETLDADFYQRHPTGDLMARATNDLAAVRLVCGPAIMYSTNTVITALGALGCMLYIHPGLTFWALLPLPFAAVATKIFGQRIHVYFQNVQELFSDLSAKVQENLAGARVVRAYTQEEREKELFAILNARYLERNERLIRWSAAFQPVLQGIVGVGYVAVLWYGCRMLILGELSIGQFVTFNLFLGKLIWPMISIGWVINQAQRAAASYGRMRSILTAVPKIADAPGLVDEPETETEIRGAVRFAGLDFSFSDKEAPALRGIDLEVEAGQTVAVVGRTGSGKSTLLSLLPRLLEPPAGTLLIDGVEVHELPLARLRRAIAMVPQESFLFSTTIRENIALGRPEASPEDVDEAARLAGLEVDIESFPQGLETMVGERGITLSGGQKQRVALARAILRDAPILALDDCLSAVDAETEARILGHLRTVFPGRTVFQVSHRVSAVRDADLIVVLDRGEIRERGTHDELLALGGLYADLNRRQMLEEELATV